MTLVQLSLYIALFAIALTALEYKYKLVKNFIYSLLQNFVGALFIVSGAVKIVDPLGTAFKMEDYFEQFYLTFADTSFSFIAPLFPFLTGYSATVSMIVVVFEIVLGVMMMLGLRHKLTAWLYVLLVIFFSLLTGFTYLTGYVPASANFFDFSAWQPYQASNMRVTDCGCFGDFILLDPGVSFLKDLLLLIPGLIFLFFTKLAHSIFKPGTQWAITIGVTLLTTIYGLSNYVWNIPDFDFRPFKEGADVRAKKIEEAEAMADVKIIAFRVENTETGEVEDVPYQDYMSNYSALYGTEAYKTIDQVKSEPTIEPTKISDFSFFDDSGYDVADEFLEEEGYTFMLIAYKYLGDINYVEAEIFDTTYIRDTIVIIDPDNPEEPEYHVVENESITSEIIDVPDLKMKSGFQKAFAEKLNPILNKAMEDGYNAKGLFGGISFESMHNLLDKTDGHYDVYEADDITLKTIIRSNPGLALWKDGKIIKKWHYKKVPTYSEIKAKYIN